MKHDGRVSKLNKPFVVVAIINYNGRRDTIECIGSLLASSYMNWIAVVVDNASPDKSGNVLEEAYCDDSRIIIKKSSCNLGFGKANNLVMRAAFDAGAAYVLLLNNDTVIEPDMLERLVDTADCNTVVSPLMDYYDCPDAIWFAGGCFDNWGVARHEYMLERRNAVLLKKHEIEWATGCCMLVPRAAYEATGGFDESFFLYWEDTDWSIRLRRAGFRLMFEPKARLYHKVSASTGGERSPLSYYYNTRNRLYAARKLGLGFKLKLWAFGGVARGIVSRDAKHQYALRAWLDYRAGNMGMMRTNQVG